jgi:hypothetical protein
MFRARGNKTTAELHEKVQIRGEFSETYNRRLMNGVRTPLHHQPRPLRAAALADEGRLGCQRCRDLKVQRKRLREPIHVATGGTLDPGAK